MTTPMPAQESPDTSPDSATARDQVLPPDDLRPSSEEVQEQEEHDRILAAQKDIARKEAFGGPTLDDQLNWEAREAAAREDEERRAREDVNGPEPDIMREADATEAEQVVDGVQVKLATLLPITPVPSHDEKLALQSLAEAPQPNSVDPQDDGDSITVVPRTKLPPIDTGKPGASKSRPQPRTAGVSSGAVGRSSISQTAGEASGTPQMGRQVSSPEPISPTMNTRRSQDDGDRLPTVHMRTPLHCHSQTSRRSKVSPEIQSVITWSRSSAYRLTTRRIRRRGLCRIWSSRLRSTCRPKTTSQRFTSAWTIGSFVASIISRMPTNGHCDRWRGRRSLHRPSLT